jgi:hypothetical protein
MSAHKNQQESPAMKRKKENATCEVKIFTDLDFHESYTFVPGQLRRRAR